MLQIQNPWARWTQAVSGAPQILLLFFHSRPCPPSIQRSFTPTETCQSPPLSQSLAHTAPLSWTTHSPLPCPCLHYLRRKVSPFFRQVTVNSHRDHIFSVAIVREPYGLCSVKPYVICLKEPQDFCVHDHHI